MYMVHVCFYVYYTDCLGSVGMYVVQRILLKIMCVYIGDMMDVMFSACIVRRGAVGACLW